MKFKTQVRTFLVTLNEENVLISANSGRQQMCSTVQNGRSYMTLCYYCGCCTEVETLQYSQYCNIMSRLDTFKHIIT